MELPNWTFCFCRKY